MVGRFRPERRAEIAQGLGANLRHAPLRLRKAFVVFENIRIAAPVIQAGVGQAAAERIAVSADTLGERIDH